VGGVNRVLFSSASDHWATPAATYDALNAEFGFTFDPCPLRSETDGLAAEWGGVVFVNPPYSNIAAFMEKGQQEIAAGRCQTVVYLVPSRTDTRWWHDHAMQANEIRFLRGRLKFGDAKNSAPFPSALIIFRANRERLAA
jgi:phage N-6-adenine-methyltransferase